MSTTTRTVALVAAMVLLAGACSSDDPGLEDATPATSTTASSTTTTSSTAPPTTTSTAASPPPAVPPAAVQPFVCPAPPPRAEPAVDRPVHRLTLEVDLAARTVTGTVESAFTPDLASDRVQWRLWPNGPRPARGGARLEVGEVRVQGDPVAHELPNATTLVVRRKVDAGRRLEVSVDFTTTLPGVINDRLAAGDAWVRLGAFHPSLEWEPGVGWNDEAPTSGFAEASVGTTADFDVTVDVPDGLDVLGTGTTPDGGRTWRARAVREVAFTIGRLAKVQATARAGRDVAVVVGVEASTGESPDAYLAKAVRSLEEFASRYGPYPWPTYSVAITPQLSGGIEHPMHVMQGPGTLGRTTSHEVAHMWFYGLVGNHQGRDPWIDEGLATWAEGVYEGTTASILGRSIPAAGRDRIGASMAYWESNQSAYYRGVYVQGAQAIGSLGEAAEVDCALAHLVATQAHRVARPADVAEAFAAVFGDVRPTLERYGATGL